MPTTKKADLTDAEASYLVERLVGVPAQDQGPLHTVRSKRLLINSSHLLASLCSPHHEFLHGSVGMELPTIEVRAQGLAVETEVHAGRQQAAPKRHQLRDRRRTCWYIVPDARPF
jgi:hypothetical protein